jgi:hypothetical protein
MLAKKPIEEWPDGITAMLDGRRRETALLLHEFFELDQHLVVYLRWRSLNLQRPRNLSHAIVSETNPSSNRSDGREHLLRDHRLATLSISWRLI